MFIYKAIGIHTHSYFIFLCSFACLDTDCVLSASLYMPSDSLIYLVMALDMLSDSLHIHVHIVILRICLAHVCQATFCPYPEMQRQHHIL